MDVKQMDMLKIILESGPVVKSVLVLLLIASVSSWAVIFKKRKVLSTIHNNNYRFLHLYRSTTNLKDLMKKAEKLPFSPYRTMFVYAYDELVKIRKAVGAEKSVDALENHFLKFGLGGIERSLQKGVNDVNIKLDGLMSFLGSVGSLTPFIGLFGTVWGIIDSFTALAGGGATLDAVAPGIAEALVATAIGLVAAIPAVWFFNSFSNSHRVVLSEMESFGQELLNVIERSLIRGS